MAGTLVGIFIYFMQDVFSVQSQMKTALWFLIIIFLGMTGLITGTMIQKLYWEADTDPLTSLGNRRRFYRRLTDELNRIRETKNCSVLALVDVDNFKRINDTVGHTAGDQVLIRISNIFRKNVRPGDSVIRWGGDEFAFILHGCNIEEAKSVIERIRKQVEDDLFVPGITISAGLLEIRAQMDIDQIVSQADHLLYKAKQIKNSVMT